jgi:SNF2 family DNA or RNA helicase
VDRLCFCPREKGSAFGSPLSKEAILADEAGLAKGIEMERRARPILVITPANLRKQWPREIEEKFFLPTVILEAKNYNELAKASATPSSQVTGVCSHQFAARYPDELMVVPWDLAVIDEEHRFTERL